MPEPISKFTAFVAELRRRRVFRVAAFYGGIAFVIVQIIDGTFDLMGVPAWVGRLMVVLLALGFPVSMILAWVFDITPEGIVRTGKAEDVPAPRAGGKPFTSNRALIVIAVLAVAFGVWSRWGGTGETAVSVSEPALGPRSIAVLPFANLSDSQEDEYFSAGVTDDIITHLTKIGDLKVISRTSAMLYKDSPKSLRVIAEELGVANILEGTVRRHGNRVRITSQLIDARTDAHLWAETYDRELTDIFAIQSDVARKIATALKAMLSTDERQRIEKRPTESTEAYHFYLRGQYFWNRRTTEDLFRAIGYFEQAIEADSSYAQAYVGLADCYIWLAHYEIPPKQAFPIARRALARALEIDNGSAGAYVSLAHILNEHEWDWANAESAFQRAIELKPNYAEAHRLYGWYFIHIGQLDKAIAEMERALELDPLSYLINTNMAYPYSLLGQFSQAFEYLQKTLELNPDYPLAYMALGENYRRAGRHGEAVEAHEKAVALDKGNALYLSYLGYTYGVAGHRDKALAILRELHEMSKEKYVSPWAMAMPYIGLRELEQALDWLDKAYVEGDLLIAWLKVFPEFDPLRSDPRFADLLRRMKFPE
ncbi:MAG: tetratricopeptide repeat protein [Candidatus Marinimicrobia bacterium]|nr:tetratricopeptide repeat protein [Candidatus Neomarinimicrobiota bacterium]